MRHSLNRILNPNHADIFQCMEEELLVYGGSGAGKSYSIADKLLLQPIIQADKEDLKALVIRKNMPALRRTALEILEKRARAFKLPFNLNKNEMTVKILNLTIFLLGLNNKEDYEKLKSMTDVDFVWINEVPELRERDYEEVLRRLRGGHSDYQQVICDFNPIGKSSWVYRRFFLDNIGDAKKLRYTILDNHPEYLKTEKAQKYIARLKATEKYKPNLYKIYFLGEWGDLEGVIFNWGDSVPLPDIAFDEIWYGGDFGYSVDPAAYIRIYRKAHEYWVEEILYEDGLTNPQLGRRIKANPSVNPRHPSYWDSAEPKSIQELYDMGLNAKPASKGPDSVRAGIDFLIEQKIHVVEGSPHISDEQRSYVWAEDKNGNKLNVPVDFFNHAMDAIRYGIWTHMKDRPVSPRAWVPGQ